MVVDGHGELLLGGVLTDDVLVQMLLYFQRLRNLMGEAGRFSDLVVL
jgi:hypothetical protein